MQKEPFQTAKGTLSDCERSPFGNSAHSGKKRVCLFGGSFNPVHNGHLAVARAALATRQVDEVWLMVSPQNPFKVNMQLLDDEKRLAILRLAIQGESHMRACDYEFRLPRPSYTWHTLQSLHRDYPHTEFSLLIGGDNWAKFSYWYHAQDILSHCNIMVYPRADSDFDVSSLPPNVRLLKTPLCNVSSTMIREKLLRGESVDNLMPPQAAQLAMVAYKK